MRLVEGPIDAMALLAPRARLADRGVLAKWPRSVRWAGCERTLRGGTGGSLMLLVRWLHRKGSRFARQPRRRLLRQERRR